MAAGLFKSFVKNVTTAGTQVALSATALAAYEVVIRARSSNTGKVFLGDSTVDSTTGYYLNAGESFAIAELKETKIGAVIDGPFIDLADVWLDSEVNGEGVVVAYILRS